MKRKILAFILTFCSLVTLAFGLFYDVEFLFSMSSDTNYKYFVLGLVFPMVAFVLISFAGMLTPKEIKK